MALPPHAADEGSRLAALRQLMQTPDPLVPMVLKRVSEQLPEDEVVQLKQSLSDK